MGEWKLVPENDAKQHWNSWLRRLGSECIYQDFEWGVHRNSHGQTPLRFAWFEGPEPSCIFQAYVKSVPLAKVLWVPGGPVGDVAAFAGDALVQLQKILGIQRLLIRGSLMSPRNPESVCELRRCGFWEAKQKINSGLSMEIQLPTSGTDPLEKASSNWKHNLRRGLKRASIQHIETPAADEVYKTYKRLEDRKGLDEQFSLSAIQSIINVFGKDLVVFGSRDETGKLIAMRACIVRGHTAWDMWAAATEEARKNYTSHVLLSKLLEHCQSLGVTKFDLSGIDPGKAPGVYNFKKGTGAAPIEYLGEWNLGSKGVSRFLDFYLWFKGILSQWS